MLYTAPSGDSADVAIMLSLRITNVDGAADDTITANIYQSDGTTKKASIAYTLDVLQDTSVELAGTSKIVLETGDKIDLTGGVASGDLEAFVSILEIT